jgi:hypothetical protein
MSDCCPVDAETESAPPVMACPVNGARCKRVDVLTGKSLVRQLPLGMLNTQYYFCGSSDCELVYFPLDLRAPSFRRGDLLVRVGVKEIVEPAPICYCFGFTRKDIRDEIAETGRSMIAERIATEVKAGRCACEVKNPSGKCCLGDITVTIKEAKGPRKLPDQSGAAREFAPR